MTCNSFHRIVSIPFRHFNVIRKIRQASAFLRGFLNAKLGRRLGRERLAELQQSRWLKFQDQALIKSDFYRPYCNGDFDAFPVIDKRQHMLNFNSINTVGLDRDRALGVAIESEKSRDFQPRYRGYSVGLSSGTSGNRGLFVVSELERAEWAGYIVGKLLPVFELKQRVAFFLRANNNLYESVNGLLIQFRFFDLIETIEDHLTALEAFEPTVLIAPGSVLLRLARSNPGIRPSRIIAVAEVLEADARAEIEALFGCRVDQVYQCTEGFLAASCHHGNLHLNEDIALIEKRWIDRDSGRFSPIITDLRRQTQPIVRYLLDDILIEDSEPCPCGSVMTRLQAIEGRADDILLLPDANGKNVEVYPDFVRNSIVSACAQVDEYQVLQKSERLLDVRVSPVSDEVIMSIREGLERLWMRLGVVAPETQFSAFKPHDPATKQRRVLRQSQG
jgi:putative adenylate-forming enzyme